VSVLFAGGLQHNPPLSLFLTAGRRRQGGLMSSRVQWSIAAGLLASLGVGVLIYLFMSQPTGDGDINIIARRPVTQHVPRSTPQPVGVGDIALRSGVEF
jgi:hypothetical protein